MATKFFRRGVGCAHTWFEMRISSVRVVLVLRDSARYFPFLIKFSPSPNVVSVLPKRWRRRRVNKEGGEALGEAVVVKN
jgi:hypothetical protein